LPRPHSVRARNDNSMGMWFISLKQSKRNRGTQVPYCNFKPDCTSYCNKINKKYQDKIKRR